MTTLEERVAKLEEHHKYLANEIIPLLKDSIESRKKLMEVITQIECAMISHWAKKI
jgi:hypothetical protein|tara:strand:+ start:482 stop:649 length:168 start_codon:yes stop_codon:yes gene_type:complete